MSELPVCHHLVYKGTDLSWATPEGDYENWFPHLTPEYEAHVKQWKFCPFCGKEIR